MNNIIEQLKQMDPIKRSNFIYQAANKLVSLKDCEGSFYEFVKQAWPWIEGDKPFSDGWHIGAICEHLEACNRRQIKNLLINIPPRCMKSTLVSITWPAFTWINNPQEQFLYSSFSMSLSLKHSVDCRRLILSPWYQERWGNRYQLFDDQNTKGSFENTKMGARIATSTGATVTGKGGSILVCDDPNNAKDGESDTIRENTLGWWRQVWPSRRNDIKTAIRVVVQQRLHEADVSGYIMANDSDEEWVKLILPMEYEENRKSKTISLPSSNGHVWQDPRTTQGELLWSNHVDEKALNDLKKSLKTEYNIAGQLQQRPAPESGGILKKSWFKIWKELNPPELVYTIQSWDTALEARDRNAYSACTTWGVFYDENKNPNVILLNLWRGRVEYPDLRSMAQRLYFDYRDDGSRLVHGDGRFRPDMVLVEAKVSGISLIQDLIRAGIPAIRFDPNKHGDKMKRVRLITHLLEAGCVWVPAQPPDFSQLRNISEVLIENCILFPNAESRDLVDTLTQMLLRLNLSGWIHHPNDDVQSDTSMRVNKILY